MEDVASVREANPLKQGLKQKEVQRFRVQRFKVREANPLKQGVTVHRFMVQRSGLRTKAALKT